MPKKPATNGFSLFMKDVQRDMAKKGQNMPLAEISHHASPMWKNLSDSERAEYNREAKRLKNQRAGTDEGRLTSNGIPLTQILKAQEDERTHIKQMAANVRDLTYDLLPEEVAEKPFYVISFNVLIVTAQGDYYPNEIGLVEYTIKDGITKSYHCFIEPGGIPAGYSASAKEHSEMTHKIPFLGFELHNGDYEGIFENILDFTHARRNKVIIFSHRDQLEQNTGCLNWLRKRAGFEDTRRFFLADLTMLLGDLRMAAGNQYPSNVAVVDALNSNSFDYVSNTRCDYHEDLDNPHCALGFSRRLCFIMSDELVQDFEIELTPSHMPERSLEYSSMVWHPIGPLRPVRNIIDVPIKPVVPHTPTTIVTGIKTKYTQFDDSDDDDTVVLPSKMLEQRPGAPRVDTTNFYDFPAPQWVARSPAPLTTSLYGASGSKSTVADRLRVKKPAQELKTTTQALSRLNIGRGRHVPLD